MTDDEKAQACAEAFRPLADMKPKPKPWHVTKVVSVRIQADLDQYTDEEAERILRFLKDHRSLDGVQFYVHRERKLLCKYCDMTPDDDLNGYPWCCGKAQSDARDLGIKES